jgi:hypothetical protein
MREHQLGEIPTMSAQILWIDSPGVADHVVCIRRMRGLASMFALHVASEINGVGVTVSPTDDPAERIAFYERMKKPVTFRRIRESL